MEVRSGNFGNAVSGLALACVDAIERANLVGTVLLVWIEARPLWI